MSQSRSEEIKINSRVYLILSLPMARQLLLVGVSDRSAPVAFAKSSGLLLDLRSTPLVMNSHLAWEDYYKRSLVPL